MYNHENDHQTVRLISDRTISGFRVDYNPRIR
jgi:hypothetical protein